MAEIPDLPVELPEISQVAFVVEDLEDGVERFSGLLGVEPWEVHRFAPPDLTERTYRGEPADYSMRLALADLAGIEIELIEPLSGPNVYADHLEDHGEGLHHVACFAFDDPAGVVGTFADIGVAVLQHGRFHGIEFWYLDTDDVLNGTILEVVASAGTLPDPEGRYPAPD